MELYDACMGDAKERSKPYQQKTKVGRGATLLIEPEPDDTVLFWLFGFTAKPYTKYGHRVLAMQSRLPRRALFELLSFLHMGKMAHEATTDERLGESCNELSDEQGLVDEGGKLGRLLEGLVGKPRKHCRLEDAMRKAVAAHG